MDEGSNKHLLNAKNFNKQIRTMMNLHNGINDNDDNVYRQSIESHNSAKKYTQYSQQSKIGKNRKVNYSTLGASLQRQGLLTRKTQGPLMRSVDKRYVKKLQQNFNDQTITNNEADSQKQTIKVCHDRLSRYQNIVLLTQQQNQNLKQQNQYLLKKLRSMQERQQRIKRLYSKAKDYKLKWLQVKQQIDIVRQQTYIYRSLLQDFKQIALVDIPVLKQKVRQTQQGQYIQQTSKRDFYKQRQERKKLFPESNSKKNYLSMKKNDYECIDQQSEEAQQKTFIDNLKILELEKEQKDDYE